MKKSREGWIKNQSDFSEAIHPISAAIFFEKYYEQHPLYIANRYTPSLHHLKDHVLRKIIEGEINSNSIVLAQHGNIIEREYLFNARGEFDLTEALARHLAGATLIVNDFHKYDEPTAELNSNFQQWFNCPCGANLYITPARQKGFSAHFDPHDVFVLQVEGSKHWRIFEAHSILPLKGQVRPVPRKNLGKPSLEIKLQEGDLLYIPRGWTHEAEALESFSAHITLGVFAFTRADLALDILAQAIVRDASFRNALPPLFTSDTRDELRHTIKDLLKKLAKSDIIDNSINNFINRIDPEEL